jgi:hypothetical protein
MEYTVVYENDFTNHGPKGLSRCFSQFSSVCSRAQSSRLRKYFSSGSAEPSIAPSAVPKPTSY